MSMICPPPLSLYIHIPWCIKKCPYCDFNSHTLKTTTPPEADYIKALQKDLIHDLRHFKIEQRPLHSIFIGGGTPSLFSGATLATLLETLDQTLPCLSHDIEITLEANPGTLTIDRLKAFKAAGINRLSIGIQSFNNKSLEAIGRIHNATESINAIENARAAGFSNINIDLMYGLPGQTHSEAIADLNLGIQMAPEHLSWYELTLEPNTLFYQRPPKQLPDHDDKWSIEQEGHAQLADHGYHHYEISAFSRPHYSCQHNLNYWRFGDYLGIGAGAHGKITQVNGAIIRSTKLKHPQTYLSLSQTMENLHKNQQWAAYTSVPAQSLPLEFMLNYLRLYEPLSLNTFTERTGLPAHTLNEALEKLADLNLLTYLPASRGDPAKTASRIELTQRGRALLNEVLEYFMDRTLEKEDT